MGTLLVASLSLVFVVPTSSLSENNMGVGAVVVGGMLSLPPLSPNKLSPGKFPLQRYYWAVENVIFLVSFHSFFLNHVFVFYWVGSGVWSKDAINASRS